MPCNMQMIKRILKFSEMLSCSPLISLPSSVSPSIYIYIYIYISLSLEKNNFKLTFFPFPDLSEEVNEN